MRTAANLRYELRHRGERVGIVRAGAIDWISAALNDEAVFWFGWLGIASQVRAAPAPKAKPAWFLAAMQDSIRRSAYAAAASNSRD